MSRNRNEIRGIVTEYLEEQFHSKSIFVPGVTPIPTSGALLYPDDIALTVDAVLDGWFTEFKYAARLKESLQRATERKYIQLCNSGSSANLLAISAIRELFPDRKLVVTTALAFPTTISPIYQNGLIPLFVDINTVTLAPDYMQFLELMNKYRDEIAGVFFTHTMGFPFQESIVRDAINVILGEKAFFATDQCDALGAKDDKSQMPVGSFSDISTYSFFPAHQITSGEGGAVATDFEDLYKVVQSLCNWGRDCYCLPGQQNVCGNRFGFEWRNLPKGWDHKYTFTRLGYNLKMTEIQAALGYAQMRHLDDFVQKRRENFLQLSNGIEPLEDLIRTVRANHLETTSPFGFPIIVKRNVPFETRELIEFLESKKIHTRRLFGANIIRQPVFERLGYIHRDLTGSDYLMEKAFWIGCHPSLDNRHIEYMLEQLHYFLDRYL